MTAPGYPASVVFYSDNSDGVDALADTGFPTAFYTNTLTFTETGLAGGANGFVYTPTAGQPGFIAGFGTTYTIISDADVPEPATLGLFGAGVLGLIGYSRRRRAFPDRSKFG